MKFTDLSNERTVLDEGAWDSLATWTKSKWTGQSPDEMKMRKAIELNVKELQRITHSFFPKGQDVDVENLLDFFNDLGYGKSGLKVVNRFENKNIIENNTLPYDQLDAVLANVVQQAVTGDAAAFVKKAGIGKGVVRGSESSADREVAKKDQETKEKEQTEAIIDKMGQEFLKMINASDDEELRDVRFQAYKVFRQVAAKYGKSLPEPSNLSDEG